MRPVKAQSDREVRDGLNREARGIARGLHSAGTILDTHHGSCPGLATGDSHREQLTDITPAVLGPSRGAPTHLATVP